MTLSVCSLSHSPLLHTNEPGPGVRERADAAIEQARAFVRDVDPELVVLLAPDHDNGFFYDTMPPFCIGAAAISVGDYGTSPGPLHADQKAAEALAAAALDADLDIALSERMHVDHGFVQPMELRQAREQRVITAGRDYAAGRSSMQPLNEQWDRAFPAVLAAGRLEQIDGWSNTSFVEQAGHCSHEVRTSIAAYAALSTAGPYIVTSSFYEAIPAWIAGFAVTTARTA